MLLFIIGLLISTLALCWTNSRRLGYRGVSYCIITVLGICSICLFLDLYYLWLYEINWEFSLFSWATLGNNIHFFISFRADFFNISLALVMTSGGFLVFSFAINEMWDEKDGTSFIINLGFFLFFMLVMTTASNLLLFYFGWEGIGLMSLVLVSFWSERVRSIKATFKIFVINKIGDVFLVSLISLLVILTGETDFYALNTIILLLQFKLQLFYVNYIWLIELLGILLVFSGSVKSAQIGFHIWLLEAMEAPLGASALMHSSTLVIAGLILIFKLQNIFYLSVYAPILAFWLGTFTAAFAAFAACFQFELKVIMAYSTISNMGYLFALLGLGALNEFFYLLIVHAYIKIFLFLIMGNIIWLANGCQDIRWISQFFLPSTVSYSAFVIGSLNLLGAPFWSGYFCKQFILQAQGVTLFRGGEYFLVVSFLLTLVYNARLGYLLFLGPKLGHHFVYVIKNTSILNCLIFVFLGISLIVCAPFWINLISQLQHMFLIFSPSILKLKFFISLWNPSNEAYWLWLNVYWISFLLLFFSNLITLSPLFNSFKAWYYFIIIVFSFFFFYYVICLYC